MAKHYRSHAPLQTLYHIATRCLNRLQHAHPSAAPVTRHIHLTSHIAPHTSHITHHTSHITHRTLHPTHHTSHITHHASHITRRPSLAPVKRHILHLNSSTPSKFSRHLVVTIPGAVWADNTHAGAAVTAFVQHCCAACDVTLGQEMTLDALVVRPRDSRLDA